MGGNTAFPIEGPKIWNLIKFSYYYSKESNLVYSELVLKGFGELESLFDKGRLLISYNINSFVFNKDTIIYTKRMTKNTCINSIFKHIILWFLFLIRIIKEIFFNAQLFININFLIFYLTYRHTRFKLQIVLLNYFG